MNAITPATAPPIHRARTLWKLTAGQRWGYLLAIATLAAGTGCMYLAPLVVRGAIDGLIDHASPASTSPVARLFRGLGERHGLTTSLAIAGALVVAITALGGSFLYAKGRWAAKSTEKIIQSLRRRLYDHLQHVNMSWHDKVQTGDIVQRCTSDVETVRAFYSNQIMDISQNLLRVLIVVPVLYAMDWRMATASMAIMPFIIAFAIFFFSRVQGTFKKADEAEGAMSATLQENLTGIRVVRAFARQAFEIDRFRIKNESNRITNWRLYKIMATYWASSDFLCLMQSALLLLVGTWRVLHDQMTVGTLVAFVSYGQMFIWPLREVGRVLTELGKAMVSIGRIEEVLSVPLESAPTPLTDSTTPPTRVRGEIELRNVEFSFGDRPILRGVNLKIPAGSTLAILGPSGSGKTTLVNLLLRMYDYQGSITLDGLELNRLDRKFARAQFGVVLQEPFLYSKTLADNMKLGRHTASDEEMFAAAQIAAIHETVDGFEKKYQTLIGERGVTLSGGQRQRTAIARALLRDAPILILDDALSAVDTQTETDILDALRARRGRTVILIAHRLSTLMHADQIAVMEHGRIIQLGSHHQLIEQDGLYRRLWQIQTALEDDLRGNISDDSPLLETAKG